MPPAPLKARWALSVSPVQTPIAKVAEIDRRVLRGALSRLEPGAGKLARRVLRGGVSRKARPLPDGTRAKRGKPNRSHRNVESRPQGCACGRVGMGCRKKRMPVGNRPDRGSSFALSRKGADFRLVLDREKGTERLNRRGYFRRCVPLAALKARWALCVSSVQPRIAKAAGIDRRVLHGALSRLEPGAGKLARRVLRGPGGGDVTRLPDWPTAYECRRRPAGERLHRGPRAGCHWTVPFGSPSLVDPSRIRTTGLALGSNVEPCGGAKAGSIAEAGWPITIAEAVSPPVRLACVSPTFGLCLLDISYTSQVNLGPIRLTNSKLAASSRARSRLLLRGDVECRVYDSEYDF